MTSRKQSRSSCEQVILTSQSGQEIQASVIHIWKRGDVSSSDSATFTMKAAAGAVFDANPAIMLVMYLWTERNPLLLAGDCSGHFVDTKAEPVGVRRA